jgi:hypothetical protein
MSLENNRGNADVAENMEVREKAIRKLMKTKGRFCTREWRVMKDDGLVASWGAEIGMVARVPPLRSPSPRNRAEE